MASTRALHAASGTRLPRPDNGLRALLRVTQEESTAAAKMHNSLQVAAVPLGIMTDNRDRRKGW